jgi:hypothetical protein
MATSEAILHQTWFNTFARFFKDWGGGIELEGNGETLQVHAPINTGMTDVETINIDVAETREWLASIVGAFDSDPFYAQMIANIEENRRRMIAEYEAVE